MKRCFARIFGYSICPECGAWHKPKGPLCLNCVMWARVVRESFLERRNAG
jgi:hypothetical protein